MEMPVQSKKSLTSILMFLVGGILVVLGQYLIDVYPIEERAELLYLEAFGIIFVFFGVWTLDKGFRGWLIRFLSSISKYSISEWQLLCLVLSVPIVMIVPFAAGNEPKMANPLVAVFAWILAICLVLVGVLGATRTFAMAILEAGGISPRSDRFRFSSYVLFWQIVFLFY